MKKNEGWKMLFNNHFEIKKGEYTGIVKGLVFGCGYWKIVKGDQLIEDCFRHPAISGSNIELATKAFVEKRLSILTP